MPKNLELKARCPSLRAARACAKRLGARPAGILHQRDTYFRVAGGRLKLRECPERGAELIYYERPERRPERWSRYTAVPVADPAPLRRALAAVLGVTAVVRKQRELHLTHDARIHLDAVQGLGAFIEFEVTAGKPEDARRSLRHLKKAFGVLSENLTRGSYGEMTGGKRISRES